MHLALALARDLVGRHPLPGWTVVLDDAKTRAGVCRPARKQIGLSRPLTALHSEAEVRDTILHEIAHALVGAQHGHDAVWRAKAREVGCSATRCLTSENGRLEGDWRGVCPGGHVTTRHRRPQRVRSCGQCAATFDPDAVLTWTHRGRRVPMSAAYLAEAAAVAARRQAAAAAATGAPAPSPARAPFQEPARTQAAALDGQPSRATAPPVHPRGTQVRLLGAGRFAGLTGTVVKFARTRYHVQTTVGLVAAPIDLVRPV